MKQNRWMAGVAALVMTGGVTAAVLASGAEAAVPANYVKTQATQVNLDPSGTEANGTTVVSQNVQAGNWRITAQMSPVNFQTDDVHRCKITQNGVNIGSSAVIVGSNTGVVESLHVDAAIHTAGPSTAIGVTCWHDNPIPGSYLDPNGRLIITKLAGTLSAS